MKKGFSEKHGTFNEKIIQYSLKNKTFGIFPFEKKPNVKNPQRLTSTFTHTLFPKTISTTISKQNKMFSSKTLTLLVFSAVILTVALGGDSGGSGNTNTIYSPCSDTRIQRSDGFTFGIAFSSRPSFFINQTVLLSPCDRRLSLAAMNSQFSVFRPKIDEISLLSINTSAFFPVIKFLIINRISLVNSD